MPDRLARTLDQAVRLHQSGRLQQAERLYREILAAQPDHADALHLLGVLTHQSGRPGIAVELIEQAIALRPGAPAFHYNLAHVLREQGRIDMARDSLQAVLRLAPGHLAAHNDLAGLHHQAGRLDKAAEHYRVIVEQGPAEGAARGALAAVRLEQGCPEEAAAHFAAALSVDPGDLTLRNGLVQALQRSSPDGHRPGLERALERCFAWSDVNHQHLSTLTAAQIKYKYAIGGRAAAVLDPDSPDFDQDLLLRLFTDGLFVSLLTKTINLDRELEIGLTALRRALLLRGVGLSGTAEWRIMSGIARQAFNNGYAFWAGEDEEACVAELKSQLEARPVVGDPGSLLRFAMYATPRSLSHSGELRGLPVEVWPEPLKPLVEKTLTDSFEEEAIKAAIPVLGAIGDETSRAVQAQYEESPYPRWLAANRQSHADFADSLRRRLPYFQVPAFLAGPVEILVAGCGTGLQPISLALSYRDLRVTAVDLSKSSLAYAVRMAGRLGLDNIEFLQGDILELSALHRQFPVIECSGVLHHMAWPDRGLEVLVSLLRPGGVIKIGLYSELARRDLDTLRARFGQSDGAPTAAAIRAFRRRVLTSPEAEAFGRIIGSPDFNNLSGCRDLLFHTRERRYSPLELEHMIDRQALRFLGFDLTSPATRRLYRARFPDDPAMTSFTYWQSFEAEFPDSFADMYRFWCQKPAA